VPLRAGVGVVEAEVVREGLLQNPCEGLVLAAEAGQAEVIQEAAALAVVLLAGPAGGVEEPRQDGLSARAGLAALVIHGLQIRRQAQLEREGAHDADDEAVEGADVQAVLLVEEVPQQADVGPRVIGRRGQALGCDDTGGLGTPCRTGGAQAEAVDDLVEDLTGRFA